MVRVTVGLFVMIVVMFVVDERLHRCAARRLEVTYQLRKNSVGLAGLTGLGIALPVMGEYGSVFFLLPAAAGAALFRLWYGDR